MQNLTINQYVTKKIFKNFIGIFFILIIIIFGNQLFIVSKESLKLGLLSNEIIQYISFKILRDIHQVINLSFLASIILTLVNMNKNSEKIIIHFAGISQIGLVKRFHVLFIAITITSLIFSLFISPFAKKEIYNQNEVAKTRPNYLFLKEGEFQNFSGFTFFSPKIISNDNTQNLKSVFLFSEDSDKTEIISAAEGIKYYDKNTDKVLLTLINGQIFQASNLNKNISKFDKYTFKIYDNEKGSILDDNNKVELQSSFNLLNFNSNQENAEIFHRLSSPVMLFILVFLFTLIVESNPRNPKKNSMLFGMLIYTLYFNLLIFVQRLIAEGDVSFILGFIGSHAFFIGIIMFFYFSRNNVNSYGRKTIKKT